MNRFDSYSDKALALVTQVGDGLKNALPDTAGKWLQTGAALGVAKTGTRVAGQFIRRNPAVAVAAAVGAGLVWYMAHRQAKKKQNGHATIEGKATRVEAKRAPATPRKRAASKRATRSTRSSD
jgi:hypothetical protein